MSAAERIDNDIERVERWFIDRGLPHFIADYSASRDVLTRAVPILSLIFLIEVLGALNLEWPWWANVASVAGGVALLVGAWAAVNAAARRPALARPQRLGAPEVAVFVAGPALLPLVFGGQVLSAATTAAGNLLLFLVIYGITSYGLVPMAVWALRHMGRQVGALFDLLVRTLPLLLLFVTFLFVNAEVWQLGASLDMQSLWTIVALFVALGTLFVATRLPRELSRLSSFTSWDEVDRLTRGTPAERLAPAREREPGTPLTRRQWINVGLVALFSQGIQIIFVSVLIGAFFVAFGLIAITPGVIEAWAGLRPHELTTLNVGARSLILSRELVQVAIFLASFSGLYFTVSAITDETYRKEFYEDILEAIRKAFAVRETYLATRVPG